MLRVLMAVAAVPQAQGALEFLARTNREEANELVRRLTMSGRRLGACHTCHTKKNARPEHNMDAKGKKSLENAVGPFYLTGNPIIEKLLEKTWFLDPFNNPEESNATFEGWAVVRTEKGRTGELPDERVVLEVMVIPPSGVVVDKKEQVDNLVKVMTKQLIMDVKQLEEKAVVVEAAKKEAKAGQGNTVASTEEDAGNAQVMDEDPRSDQDDEDENVDAGKDTGDETNSENTTDANEDPKVEYRTLEVGPEDLTKYRKFARLVTVKFRVISVDNGVTGDKEDAAGEEQEAPESEEKLLDPLVAEVSNLNISCPNEKLFDELTQALDPKDEENPMELTYDVDTNIEKNRVYPTELIYNIKAKQVDKKKGVYRLELRIISETIINEETKKKRTIATGLHKFKYVVDPDATGPQMTQELAQAWNRSMPTLTVEFMGARVLPKTSAAAMPLDESFPDEAAGGAGTVKEDEVAGTEPAKEDEAAPSEEQELLEPEDGSD